MYLARTKHITVNTFFDGITDEQLENFNIKKNDTVIVSANTIKLTLKQMFGSFEIIHSDSTEMVIGYWNNFKTVYRQAFGRMYDALNTEYNAIENYNKVSTITTNGTGNSTTQNELTSKETTEDSATFHDTAYSTGNNTTTATNTNTVTEHTSGNIGTTTNMHMLSEEWQGRIEMNLAKVICELYAEMELI